MRMGIMKCCLAKVHPWAYFRRIARSIWAAGAQVRDGDLLILYTDGVIEAVNSAGEEFGMDRLMSTLHEVRDRKPEEIVKLFTTSHRFFRKKSTSV